MRSSTLLPRSRVGACSPSTHRIASTTFDLPHPLGPTTAVIPGAKPMVVESRKDLKPSNSRLLRRMLPSPPPHHHHLKAYPKVPSKGQEHPQHIVCRRKGTPASCGPWAWGPVLRPVRRGDGRAVLGPRSVGGGMKEESPARWAAGAAAPAPASRRRENLRSASF